jgi:hypothetical protein
MCVGSSGLASAHSDVSHASLKHKPKVYVDPKKVDLTTYGTGAFVLHGRDMGLMAPYTITSAELGTPLCPLTSPVPLSSTTLTFVMTDIGGDFAVPFNVGTSTTSTPSSATAAITNNVATIAISIPNPFGAGGSITISGIPNVAGTSTFTIPNPFLGIDGTVTATVTSTATTTTITIPNPLGGTGTITIPLVIPNVASTTATAAITNTTVGTPCIPNEYHISVQQPITHENYSAEVKITT